jgi:hypothetical protein
MKKLSLENLIKEADVLKYDQNLKFAVAQKLPHFYQAFMKQIKADQYDQAIQTLGQLAAVVQETQQLLTAAIQKNPNVKNPGVQSPGQNTKPISNEEL